MKNPSKDLLSRMKDFKFEINFHVNFRKETENGKTKYSPPICFSSKTKKAIIDLGTDDSLETSQQTILSKVQ